MTRSSSFKQTSRRQKINPAEPPAATLETYRCPVEVTLEVIGGKWKAVILWHLTFRTLRFSQLQRRLAGITQKMLTQQLRELERDALVARKVYAEVPPRVEYSLTAIGRTLEPLLQLMRDWGNDHLQRSTAGTTVSSCPAADQDG